jgi:hypothetical protein
MATTTNYAWETPDDTDLVKDGAAAIRTLGSSIDTTTKALNPSTTLGDIEYRSATANTNTRLGIGTSGQVLTVNGSGVPAWATAAGGGANWSLLNAGGTALTGASTITVSGISGKDKIMVLVDNASGASAESTINIRFNADSGNNYYRYGSWNYIGSSYVASNFTKLSNNSSGIVLGKTSTDAASQVAGYCLVTGANSSGAKVYNSAGQGSAGSGSDHTGYVLGGYYDSSSTISSVSVVGGSNFDGGTVYVYTSA